MSREVLENLTDSATPLGTLIQIVSTQISLVPALLQGIQGDDKAEQELCEDVLLAVFGILRRVLSDDGRYKFDDRTMSLQGEGLEDESNALPELTALQGQEAWVWNLVLKIPALLTPAK